MSSGRERSNVLGTTCQVPWFLWWLQGQTHVWVFEGGPRTVLPKCVAALVLLPVAALCAQSSSQLRATSPRKDESKGWMGLASAWRYPNFQEIKSFPFEISWFVVLWQWKGEARCQNKRSLRHLFIPFVSSILSFPGTSWLLCLTSFSPAYLIIQNRNKSETEAWMICILCD